MRRKLFLPLLLILGAVLFTGSLLSSLGLLRSFSPGSKLHLFETRIASVEEEFMRRIPALQKNFTQFSECMKRDICQTGPILHERDSLIQQYWPELLKRLAISGDWGKAGLTDEAHQSFLRDIEGAGGLQRSLYCLPEIHYYKLASGQSIYTYEGLSCPAP